MDNGPLENEGLKTEKLQTSPGEGDIRPNEDIEEETGVQQIQGNRVLESEGTLAAVRVAPMRAEAFCPAVGEASLIQKVKESRVRVPWTHRREKPFFRFLRKAASSMLFVEQVQRLRDAIVLSAMRDKKGPGGLVVGLAGPRGGEGTSVVSLLVGLALGECTQRRVAFFDGRLNADRFDLLSASLDLSRNSLCLQKGLSEVAGYYNSKSANLCFLRNTAKEASISFFSDKRLELFLQDLRSHFDFVVLDIPPLLKETGGLFALPYLDRLYLVAEADSTRLSEIDRCLEVAAAAGNKISAVILNKQKVPWWVKFFGREIFF